MNPFDPANPRDQEGVGLTILHHLDFSERGRARSLNKAWGHFLGDDPFARWLCCRLHEECRIYAPPRPPPGESWRSVFADLWPLRATWLADLNDDKSAAAAAAVDEEAALPKARKGRAEKSKCHIGVLVRFRPEVKRGDSGDAAGDTPEADKAFFLPLHQRLQLIRSRDKHKRSKRAPGAEPGTAKPGTAKPGGGGAGGSDVPGDTPGDTPGVKPRASALRKLQEEGGWFGRDWKKKAPLEQNASGDPDGATGKQGDGTLDPNSMVAHINDVDPMSGRVVAVAPGVGLREFEFDHVFNAKAGQSAVYEAATRRLLTDFLNGVNATILVYGQTGSGKTFTMFGEQPAPPTAPPAGDPQKLKGTSPPGFSLPPPDDKALDPLAPPSPGLENRAPPSQTARDDAANPTGGLLEVEKAKPKASNEAAPPGVAKNAPPPKKELSPLALRQLRGIVPRAAAEVLVAVAEQRRLGIDAQVSVSYVEVFGDEVTDLLQAGKRCGHSKVAAQRYVLSGATGLAVSTVEELEALLVSGERVKRKAATKMNARSSRAHALFIMTLEQRDLESDKRVKSQLFLADLGGSEQVKRSQVHHGVLSEHHGHVLGDQMREAVYINLGLLALKKCIEALNRDSDYVPYQDSKLTMLLSPALGGDSKATVVVCGSMDRSDAKETVQALRFGEACSRVENTVNSGMRGAAALLDELESEIARLELEIQRKERWEVEEQVREDALLEEGTFEAAQAKRLGGEVVRVGKVVGAEEERALLEGLIVRRAELLGEDPGLSLAEHGFGGQFGGRAEALGGHAAVRFASKSKGLKIKGKVVAEWEP